MPVIPSGVEVVTIDPEQVTVTVTEAGASTPGATTPPASATATPSDAAQPTVTPSATP